MSVTTWDEVEKEFLAEDEISESDKHVEQIHEIHGHGEMLPFGREAVDA